MKTRVGAFCLLCVAAYLSAQQGSGESVIDDIAKTATPLNEAAFADEDAADADNTEFDENEFFKNFTGPEFTVVSDSRSKTQYIVSKTESETTEYHDLKDIEYGNLIYVLTDLFRKIREDGFVYASEFVLEYGEYPYPTLVYKKPNDGTIAYGILQFPQFQIAISGTKTLDSTHPNNIRSANILQSMMFKFIFLLAEVEETTGTRDNDLLKFFAPVQ
jgi:hypothetical protein